MAAFVPVSTMIKKPGNLFLLGFDRLLIGVSYLHLVDPPPKQKAKAKNLSLTGAALTLTSLNLKKIADAVDLAEVLN